MVAIGVISKHDVMIEIAAQRFVRIFEGTRWALTGARWRSQGL
jgi:hypothetical protein